jgi:hypothetical protein
VEGAGFEAELQAFTSGDFLSNGQIYLSRIEVLGQLSDVFGLLQLPG